MNIEILEARVAPATLSSFVAGVLTITGDGGANDVTISEQTTAGAYHVSGLDAGQTADFTGVTRIVVNLDGGDDSVVFAGSTAAGTSLRSVAVSGTDALEVSFNGNFNVRGGVVINHTGNDAPAADEDLSVVVTGSGTVLGQLVVKDGSSDSSVSVLGGARIAAGLIVNGGEGGDDDLTLNAAVIGGGIRTTSTGTGTDDVKIISSVVRGGLKVRADGGTVEVTDSQIHGTLSGTFFGLGANAFNITGSSEIGGNLFLNSGAGDDSVNIIDATIGGRAAFSLGLDDNSAILNNVDIGGDLSFLSGAAGKASLQLINGTNVAGSVSISARLASSSQFLFGNGSIGGSLLIAGGAGADVVDVDSFSVSGSFDAALGFGANSTNLSNFSADGSVRVGGGAGSDVLTAVALAVRGAFLTQLGAGTNSASLSGSVGALTGLGGAEADAFLLSSLLVRGQTRLVTGDGNDSVLTADSRFSGAFSFLAGAGIDTLNLEEGLNSDNGIATTFLGTFFFDGALGDDHVVLGASSDDSANFMALAFLNGGLGADTLASQFAFHFATFRTFSFS